MSARICTCAAWLVAAAVAAPASAQQPPRDTLARPFVRGGAYDKPYQTTLAGRTAIGGYAEAQARWQRVDGAPEESGFEAKRFNIFTSTRVSDFIRIGAELEWEDGGTEIKLEYAAIDFLVSPAFAVRGGMILSPIGRFNLAHDSPRNDFTDRPLVSTDILGATLSEPGLGAIGRFAVGRGGGRVTYEAYATNGFGDGLIANSPDGTRVANGRGNVEDNNGSPAFVGRLAWSPGLDHEIGVSAHRGAYNVFQNEGTTVDKRRDLTLVALDGETRLMGVRFMGEAGIANVDIPTSLAGINASRQVGWYVDAVREFGKGWVPTMPASAFELKARWDAVDYDARSVGQSAARVTVGANFRPTPESVLKFDYVRGRTFDEFNNRSDHAFILFSIATYF